MCMALPPVTHPIFSLRIPSQLLKESGSHMATLTTFISRIEEVPSDSQVTQDHTKSEENVHSSSTRREIADRQVTYSHQDSLPSNPSQKTLQS